MDLQAERALVLVDDTELVGNAQAVELPPPLEGLDVSLTPGQTTQGDDDLPPEVRGELL